MGTERLAFAVLLAVMAVASPAAGGPGHHGGAPHGRATKVPEPADAALFGLGIVGVVLGRRFRHRRG